MCRCSSWGKEKKLDDWENKFRRKERVLVRFLSGTCSVVLLDLCARDEGSGVARCRTGRCLSDQTHTPSYRAALLSLLANLPAINNTYSLSVCSAPLCCRTRAGEVEKKCLLYFWRCVCFTVSCLLLPSVLSFPCPHCYNKHIPNLTGFTCVNTPISVNFRDR